MSQSIGSKISGGLVGILIGLLVVSFAVWGVNDAFSPNSKDAVMSLGDNEVSRSDFDQAFRRELITLAQTDGRQMTHQEAYDRGIHQRVLERLLTEKVIEVDANDLGVGVNARSARDYAESIEVFRDELTGEFSLTKLQQVLARQNPPMTQADFERDLILQLRQQQTLPAISGGVVAPLEFGESAYRYMTEQRKIEVLTFNQDAIPPAPEPTDEALQTYVDNNPVTFTAPEYRRVTLLRIEAEDIIPNLDVSDQEIEEHFSYKLERGEYGAPETRSVIQITADSEAKANEAVERLNEDIAPETVATLLDLIEPTRYENVVPDAILDPETSSTAFAMNEGQARAVLGSLGKWYAVQVTNINPAEKPVIDDVRDELRQELLKNKALDQIFDMTEIIEDTLDDGQPIEDAATAAGVAYYSLDFIDRTGTTREGERLDGTSNLVGLAKDETILTEIFINDIGFDSNLFETSQGGWAAIRVDDAIDSTLRPFEEVKDQARTLWKAQAIQDAMDEKMIEIASEIRNGQSMTDILSTMPVGVDVSNIVMVRSTPPPNIGQILAAQLLDAEIGDVERGTGPTPLTRQVAKLTAISASTDSLAGQIAEILQTQATSALRQDLLIAYQNAVIAEHPQREYPDQVMRVLGLDATPVE